MKIFQLERQVESIYELEINFDSKGKLSIEIA